MLASQSLLTARGLSRRRLNVLCAALLAAGLLGLLAPRPAAATWNVINSWHNGGDSNSGSGSSSGSGGGGGGGDGGGSYGSWRTARATRYDGPDDWWSIHEGSCGYGYLDQGAASGWDVAAMSDSCDDYHGSCGRCIEVKCNPMTFADGYGEQLDRQGVCRDTGASVVVQVTDTCPCNYPGNAYSNRRWCCGDMYHLDLSTWAFEKLAEKKWGVIGLQVRSVPCNYKPEKAASPPSNPTPFWSRISKPHNFWKDLRPWCW
ncbi:hypothetical protein HYH03_004534 [Edaphochlamys debaryana]|uniref:Expansin-like EG45 domain-containing protein n=1 Tax=Edaphochlamys debaryana TaxID=47281 RepID=A0A835YAR7_9CHLO|nr:hypothetical protein HYH03_004534 [Edaphochlamys debaryana]|eukprot:KAG2497376.1 hypothetical protein HYH03_004534 [Edaphochlamys debaryana]